MSDALSRAGAGGRGAEPAATVRGAMGRRSRNRTPTGQPGPKPSARTPRPRAPRPRASDGLDPARKTLAAYIVAAGILGVLTIVGIGTVGGLFGPILVFLVILTLAYSLQRNVARRIAEMELSEEDRLMRLLATGVLATAVVLAFISAVVSVVAG